MVNMQGFCVLLANFGAVTQEAADAVAAAKLGFEVQRLLSLSGNVIYLLISIVYEAYDFIDQHAKDSQCDQNQRAEDGDPDVHDLELAYQLFEEEFVHTLMLAD